MDFVAVVDQAIALLRQRGRVTYRTLQRQFQLDAEALTDLLAELRYAHPDALREDDQGIVWTGDAETAAALVPPPLPRDQYPTAPADLPAAPPGTAPSTPDAERRQLTVLFCDLVDSTALSSQLDPEEYREVVRAYQQLCSEVITRFDGHIAQLLGDGLLVYFGYPHAHEDDAQRAVRTGLGVLAAIEDPHTRLHQQAQGIQLAIRIGVHTGLVVIGEMGGQGRQEQLALGEVPNIASRIEGLAAPNTVAISEASYHLIQAYFTCESLGEQTLRGVLQPLKVYRVLGESGVHSRLDITSARGLTPLVGRESEVTLLLERWGQAQAGQGQVVLLTGDAGIGKSRLVQVLKDHVAHEPHTRWECRSAEYSQNTALFPLVELFQRILQFETGDTPDEKFGKLEQMLSQYRLPLKESVLLFAPLLLLPVPEPAYPPLHLSPQRQRQKTLEAIVAILLELAERQPLLFILEDLHWTDPTTLEWLNLLIDQTPTASLLTVLTCRPTFQPRWSHRSYLSEVTVHRLSRHQIEQMTTQVAGGKTLPPAVAQQLVERTDGVPLFVEEITKSLLESGHLQETDRHYALTGSLSTFAIPATLQDSLMARLDRLVTAKAVAQYAAVLGRQFAYELLSTVSQLDAVTLQRELGRLVEAEIVYQRGVPPQATYTFKHALIQDAAYQSLLKSTRQQYHQRIAHVLAAQFPATAETQPELLAQHYTEAGLGEQAIGYWQRAGQRAVARSAYVEAIHNLTKGLAVLETLPDTRTRCQHELTLQCALGAPLIATKGYAAPEVAHAYSRARALCQQMGETAQLLPVLYGLWALYFVRAEFQSAHEIERQLFDLSQHQHVPALRLMTHWMAGGRMYHAGDMVAGLAQLDQAILLYDPQQHQTHTALYGVDFGVFARCYASHALWLLGYPAHALTRGEEVLSLAQALAHPFSLTMVFAYLAMLHQFRGERDAAHTHAEAAIALCTEHGFGYYLAWGTLLQGWSLCEKAPGKDGIIHMRQGLTALQATGAGLRQPYYLSLLAEACRNAGEADEGILLLTQALGETRTTREHWWEAELHRLRGALLLQHSVPDAQQAAACFHQALDVARHQQAKSLELRAAISLSRLWQQQGKQAEAHELLAPVYGWFTEGFDTADLQEAKALLESLGG